MKIQLAAQLIAMIMVSLCLTTTARATTILNFDNITPVIPTGYGSYVNVPDGYGGLNWSVGGESSLTATAGHSAFDDGDISTPYGAVFGTSTHTVWNPSGTFDFISAYFTGGWFDKTAPVKGYLDNVEIYSASVSATDESPVEHTFNWTGVDKLVFPIIDDGGTPGNNDDYVVDNFTINNVVPEPSTFILATLGMLSLGMRRRRRRRR
jgi:hypothetical protein